MKPICILAFSGFLAMSRPEMSTWPVVGRRVPAIILMVVVFPGAVGP